MAHSIPTPTTGLHWPRIAWKRLIVSLVFGLAIGLLIGIAVTPYGAPLIGLGLGILVSSVALYRHSSALRAVGIGCYYLAIVGVLVPVAIYFPLFWTTGGGNNVIAFGIVATEFIVYETIFSIVGLVIVGLGYVVNRRATRRHDATD